jgi:predicted enzyme related to lactoylglutathione lyase
LAVPESLAEPFSTTENAPPVSSALTRISTREPITLNAVPSPIWRTTLSTFASYGSRIRTPAELSGTAVTLYWPPEVVAMKRVTGIGGVFFKARDAVALRQWYQKHLGIEVQGWGGTALRWQNDPDAANGMTVWTIFDSASSYFPPGSASFIINYRVENLDALLQALRDEGCAVDEKTEASEFGKFGWVTDPEGNRIELWEPPK